MATLSKKLTLSTTWQLLTTATGFYGEASSDTGNIEIVNADVAAPVGVVAEAVTFKASVFDEIPLSMPKPAAGNLYVRVSEGAGEIRYYTI